MCRSVFDAMYAAVGVEGGRGVALTLCFRCFHSSMFFDSRVSASRLCSVRGLGLGRECAEEHSKFASE